jgi:hypothetical protein
MRKPMIALGLALMFATAARAQTKSPFEAYNDAYKAGVAMRNAKVNAEQDAEARRLQLEMLRQQAAAMELANKQLEAQVQALTTPPQSTETETLMLKFVLDYAQSLEQAKEMYLRLKAIVDSKQKEKQQ